MKQSSKTKIQLVKEQREKIINNKEKIKVLLERNKKLNLYKPPSSNNIRMYKLNRLNKLKIIRNKIKINLYYNEIEISKLELSLLNY